MRKRVGILLLVLWMLSSITGCGKQDFVEYTEDGKEIVTVGYLPITHAIPVFETKEVIEQGDQDIVIRLQKFSNWTDLMDALDAGQIQGASVLAELAMGAVSQGIDLKAIALGHRDGNIVVVGNDIQSVEDLRGKTFAIPSNQSSHNILLQDMLSLEEMGFRDLQVIQLSPAEMPVSLASGAISGYCVAEPFGTQAVMQGFGHVLYSSEALWEDSICCAVVLNGRFAKNHPEAVAAFRKGYQKASQVLDKEEAMRIAQNYLGQSVEVLEQSLQCISYQELAITREAYEMLCDKVKQYHINANPPSYEEFVYEERE